MVWTLSPLEVAPVAGSIGTATPTLSALAPTARHWVDDGQDTLPRSAVPAMVLTAAWAGKVRSREDASVLTKIAAFRRVPIRQLGTS
ncbi:MAG: hypothetical protein ACLPVF_09290 [Acidimicrobiales bacterium]